MKSNRENVRAVVYEVGLALCTLQASAREYAVQRQGLPRSPGQPDPWFMLYRTGAFLDRTLRGSGCTLSDFVPQVPADYFRLYRAAIDLHAPSLTPAEVSRHRAELEEAALAVGSMA
jgi:hypothetical protein